MSRRRARQKRDVHKHDERPGAMELMARLMVGGSYRVPVEGTGTKQGLQVIDIAGACGYIEHARLGREVALTVALQGDEARIAALANRTYRRCLRAVMWMRSPRALDLSKPENRWRLRMIVYEAAFELVYPLKHRPYRLLAKEAKMRAHSYARVHKTVSAELEQLMNEASSELGRRLWGRGDALR